MSEFNVGDWVEWKSQAGGSVTTKKGKIIAIIPPQVHAGDMIPPDYQDKRCQFDGLMTRQKTSYLVAVPKGKSFHLYWPRAKHLRRIVQENE